jgi:S1-C subfamily serine protease
MPLDPKLIRDKVRRCLWVLECEECCLQGTAFVLKGYGLVTCYHVFNDDSSGKDVVCSHMQAFRIDALSMRFPVRIRRWDTRIDLAILDFDAKSPEALEVASHDDGLADHAAILIGGFPNFRLGDTATLAQGRVVSHRMISMVRRALVDAPIVTGASGGPVVDGQGRVVGVAVTGAPSMAQRYATEMHGVIPIQEIDSLTFSSEVDPFADFVEHLPSEATTEEGSKPTPPTS